MNIIILGKCRYCDRPLEQALRGRDKVYCDTGCRDAHKNEERDD